MDTFEAGDRVTLPDGTSGTIGDLHGRNQLITFGRARPAASLRAVLLDAGELRWVDETTLAAEQALPSA